jgi:hypothetical protein
MVEEEKIDGTGKGILDIGGSILVSRSFPDESFTY